MSDIKTIQNAVLNELRQHGPASMVELAETLIQYDTDYVAAAVRGLREDKAISLASGTYRVASESSMRMPGSALVKKPSTSTAPSINAEAAPTVAPAPAVSQKENPVGEWKNPFAAELPDPLKAQIQAVAERLQPRPVDDFVLKIQVLEALAPLLDGDIAEVLLNIRDDLENMVVAK